MHKESISWVILNDSSYKITLEIEEDFEMKHAKMLLNYETYLLYNVDINVKSSKAFKAINYFLKRIKGRISRFFFSNVETDVSLDWLNYYNDFVKLYMKMGFRLENIDLTLDQKLSRHNVLHKK